MKPSREEILATLRTLKTILDNMDECFPWPDYQKDAVRDRIKAVNQNLETLI